jgi:chromosomal replication initiator protein
LYIQVPSKFFYEWLEGTLCKTIKKLLDQELGKMQSYFIKIKWKTLMAINNRLRNKPSANQSNETQNVDAPFKPRSELKSFVIPGIRNLKIESQLNANYSFDNFLEGDSNRLHVQRYGCS